jgi:hypothetical protein
MLQPMQPEVAMVLGLGSCCISAKSRIIYSWGLTMGLTSACTTGVYHPYGLLVRFLPKTWSYRFIIYVILFSVSWVMLGYWDNWRLMTGMV